MRNLKPENLARTRLAPGETVVGDSVWTSEMTRICEMIGQAALTSATKLLGLVHQPTIAIDQHGVVLEVNDDAHCIFDGDFRIRNRRLTTSDREAAASLQSFIDRLPNTLNNEPFAAQPIIVRRKDKSAIVIRPLPAYPLARGPFLCADALLTFSVIEPRPRLDQGLLMRLFSLTPAEARLAALIAGDSLQRLRRRNWRLNARPRATSSRPYLPRPGRIGRANWSHCFRL
jgi:hypothetical protein